MGAQIEATVSDSDEVDTGYQDFIIGELRKQQSGEPIDEDGMIEAAYVLVAVALMRGGLTLEAVERQFDEREHQLRFSFDGEKLEVIVNWSDSDDDDHA